MGWCHAHVSRTLGRGRAAPWPPAQWWLPGVDNCRAVGFGFRRTSSPRGAVCAARGSPGMQPSCSRPHGGLVPCSAGSDAVQQNVTASSTREHLSHVHEALDPLFRSGPWRLAASPGRKARWFACLMLLCFHNVTSKFPYGSRCIFSVCSIF